jgi:exopolysaccharide biosynthesis polyprenyl glycosylphosphotransferase
MIPRWVYWVLDILVLSVAFLLSDVIAAHLHNMLASHGVLQSGYLEIVSPTIDYRRAPLEQNLWLLIIAALPMIIFLDFAGKTKWLMQPLTRIILSGPMASVLGICEASFILFSFQNLHIQISRTLVYTFGVLSAVGLSAYRLACRAYYRKRKEAGYYVRNVVIIGSPSATEYINNYFENNINPNDYRVIGCLHSQDSVKDGNAAEKRLDGSDVLGHARKLGQLLMMEHIDEVIAIQPPNDGEWMEQVIRDCDNLGILLRIVPEPLVRGQIHRLQALFPLQPLHLPAVVLSPPHLDSDAQFFKRLIDMVVAATLLILLSPLLFLIAIAIKITTPRLSVFYPWRVVGRNGERFTGYKFTTMIADADDQKEKLMGQNEMSGPVFKIKNDPRITALGRILRKFDLNELPQLWSVIKGDMSLVGPRPAGPHELVRYEFWHKRKLSIRPGITCLWQVRGRNKISEFDDWVRMDLEYIDNWSLWLDFKILIRTGFVVLGGTGS